MGGRRFFVVALLVALGATGIGVPTPGPGKTPDTVERNVAIEGSVRTTASVGALFTHSVHKLPINANLVALSFRSPGADHEALEELILESRFRGKDGWSDWQQLVVDPDEGPDLTEARAGSDRFFAGPIWVGTAGALQLRWFAPAGARPATDIRLHLINTLGDATDPSIFERIVGSISSFVKGSKAHAMTVQPGIITRAQWGANESIRECCPRYASAVHMAFVHHTVGTNSYPASQSAAIVRSIYAFHVKSRGWSDIGYNFLVDRHGQIFEGRYGGMTSPVIGAHVKGFNTGSTGISLMGTFTSASPTSSMVSSLKKLLAWKMDVHHIPPVGTVVMTSGGSDLYPVGKKKTFNRISGHRDGQQTTCPGGQAYKLLPSIRSAVSVMGLPKLYLPRANTGILRPDGDGVNETVRVDGSFTAPVGWTVTFRDSSGISILYKAFGGGTSTSVGWNGLRSDDQPARSGRIRFLIEGHNATGDPVRAGGGSFYHVWDHPNGTVLRSTTKTVWLEDGKARPVPNTPIGTSWFRQPEYVAATNQAIGRYPAGDPVGPREGTIFAGGGAYYMYSDGKLRPFASWQIYTELGYTAASAIPILASQVDDLEIGQPIDDALLHPSGSVIRTPDNVTWTVSGATRRRHVTGAARASWYRDTEVVPATAADIALPIGMPLGYREGTMLRPPDGSHWLYAKGVRQGIEPGLFLAMGYHDSASVPILTAEINQIPQVKFGHYPPTGIHVTGDWDGDGTDMPGAVRGNTWMLHNDADGDADREFGYGTSTDRFVAGDWDGDGVDTPGVVRGNVWYLNNGFDGFHDITAFAFGRSSDRIVVGDWNGDGKDTPGLVRGNVWYLNNGFDGAHDVGSFAYGSYADAAIVGDWNGNGIDTPGLVRANAWYLNNGFDAVHDVPSFTYGRPSDTFVVGDWDGDNDGSIGVVRIRTWFLKNTNAGGVHDVLFQDLA